MIIPKLNINNQINNNRKIQYYINTISLKNVNPYTFLSGNSNRKAVRSKNPDQNRILIFYPGRKG